MKNLLEKIFIVAIFCLSILSSQVAAEVDWNSAPRISNKVELARYVESERRKGKTEFNVVLANGFKNENYNEFLDWALAPHVDMTWRYVDSNTALMTYKIEEYPGTRVANAYLARDTSNLSGEEMKLYNTAVKIVEASQEFQSPLAKEFFIHDVICKLTTYSLNGSKDAIGALVYGQANCQGYTDAFYMLCRMCGLNAGRMQGYGEGDPHAWNTIDFGDGKVYCVDVTFDDKNIFDKFNSYVYFNAPLEVMKQSHSAQWDVLPNLQTNIDDRYSYLSLKGFARTASADEGLRLIAQKFNAGETLFSAMAPYDSRHSQANVNQSAQYISNLCGGKKIKLYTWRRGDYIFFTSMVSQ